MNRNRFYMYLEWEPFIKNLPAEDIKGIMMNIYSLQRRYISDTEENNAPPPVSLSPTADLFFCSAKERLDADFKEYVRKCDASKNSKDRRKNQRDT